MRYVFMDNFRGFSETLLPLKQITFLVGENSTGKSSFLKLLYALSSPLFCFSPESALQAEAELGSFDDIVSAWAADKSYFRIGVLSTQLNCKTNVWSCASFAVHTFTDRNGTPRVSRYIQYIDGRLIKLLFQQRHPKYKITSVKKTFKTEEDIIRLFFDIIRSDSDDKSGFSCFPDDITPPPPIPIAVNILLSRDKSKSFLSGKIGTEITRPLDMTWFAPIRTKPQRFYDGMQKSFSPEGDHTPFILRRSLRLRSKSMDFAKRLKAFGKASGLFDTVFPHSFDKNPQSPFEILVSFVGAELNINNVGYGVSQVLPLIVEFLSRVKNTTFAVQQPEVHLHPRAQAALGDLVFQLAKERDHRFLLETHSDYLIDRCRLRMHETKNSLEAQVLFFQRISDGNCATILNISPDGKYPLDQPPEFRDFFVNEEMSLLEV